MTRSGLYLLLLVFLAACGNQNAATPAAEESSETFDRFAANFSKGTLPYVLTDTALLNNKDTAQIRMQAFTAFIPDSVPAKIFGNKAKVRYVPMASFTAGKTATHYLVKASSGNKKAALLLVGDGGEGFKTLMPFLVPDEDGATRQQSSLDKNLTVSRSTTRKMPDNVLAEGKDVYAFSAASGRFELIMTDALDDDQELINPIDTLQRTHSLAGDYSRDKKNMVSVRDGRKEGLLTVFIHIEKNNGGCTGEIKGDAEIVGANKAIYRQAGDPCVLLMNFTKNGVTLEEQEGCGSKRDLECSFDGQYNRKKEAKAKTPKRS